MKIFYFVSFFLVLSGVLIFFSIPTIKEIRRSKIIESEIASLQSEAEKLSSENHFLREKIEYLKSDYYKESVAKNKLGLRNLGEKIVVVQPGATASDDSDNLSDPSQDQNVREVIHQESLPNYIKWWNAVKGK